MDVMFHTKLPSPTQCSAARDGGSPKYRAAKLGRDALVGFGPRAGLSEELSALRSNVE